MAAFRPRVVLVSARFTLFDQQLGDERVRRIRAHLERSAAILARDFEVTAMPLIESQEDAAAVASRVAEERAHAVVFAPTMAAPPSFAREALAGTRAPIVIWNAPSLMRLPTDYRQDEATVHSTTVGAVMYANVLVREGRVPCVVTAGHDDDAAIEHLARVVRAAAAAGALRGSTFVRLGDPIPGYLDVEASEAQLSGLGVREVAVSRSAWERAVADVDAATADRWLATLRARWEGEPGANGPWSARVALALGAILDQTGAIGGAVNCHGPWFRQSDVVGLPACLAVACQTEAGRPIACTGDQPTAIVLALARRLAGAALYCETYVPEAETGLVLVAAGGEGDPGWADPADAVSLEANDHYPGTRGEGTSITFALRRGPATLLSLSPAADGWILAWAPGEVIETRYRDMRGPNAMFRFDSAPAGDALSRWIASGATHHNALVPGRLDVEVPVLADALGIRASRV